MASRTRRSAFAAPFVVVLGCGMPAPPTLPPEDPAHTAVPIDAGMPIDAAGAVAVDATIATATATANPPAPLVLRVINMNVAGNAVDVTFNKGSKDGLATGMKGYLVDDGKRVPGSDFVLTRVTDRASWATVKLTLDQIEASPDAIVRLD